MPRNVEIKAAVKNIKALHSAAATLSASSGSLIIQEDTFFHTLKGRLKLRQLQVLFPHPEGQAQTETATGTVPSP